MENTQVPSKKKFYKRWWFWVGTVLLLFIIIGASSNTSPQKVGQNSTVAASTNQPASSGSAPQTFKVGDQVQLGDSVLTVNKVQVSQGGEFEHPSAGDEYVNLNITIQNNSSSGQYVTTLGQMFIRDAQGNSYQVTPTDVVIQNPSSSLDGQVIANSKRTGWVGFEVPQGDKGLQFQYDGSLFGGGTILVDLGK